MILDEISEKHVDPFFSLYPQNAQLMAGRESANFILVPSFVKSHTTTFFSACV